MNYKVLLLAGLSSVTLSGCGWLYGKDGWIRDTEHDYLDAKQRPPLQMPEGMTGYQPQDRYPIPPLTSEMAQQPVGEKLDIEPPALVLSAGEGVVGVQDAMVAKSLIYVEREQLWQRLLAFFERNDIKLLEANSEAGVIRTDWIQTEPIGWFRDWVLDRDIESYRWQYLFQLTPGENPNENQLVVTVSKAEALSEEQGWIAQADSRRDGVNMLNQFLGFYDEQLTADARARVLAARAGVPVALWTSPEGQSGLLANASLERTWEITPAVIERLGFLVDDKDTSKHLYYTTLAHETSGFWSSLFGGDSRRIDLSEGEYVIELKPVGDQTAILFSRDGEVLNAETMENVFPVLSEVFQERRPAQEFNRR